MPSKKRRRRHHHAPNTKLYGKIAIIAAIVCGSLLGLFCVYMFVSTSNTQVLPPAKQATIFYDVNKKELSKVYVENRVDIPFDQIPEVVKKAITDVEDERFYDHFGVDLKSIARATAVNLLTGKADQGASTITQQLARNVLLSHRKTMTRKVKEIFLAISIERRYTKEEILSRYLNQIYLGHGAYGIEAAAKLYFGKTVSKLDIHQIALIIGLPQSPNNYSPYEHPELALKRRNIVLEKMARHGTITEEELQRFSAKPLGVVPLSASRKKAAYFMAYVTQQLRDYVDEESLYTGGYKIYTTVDSLAQEAAEDAVATLTGGKPDSYGVMQPQIALIAIDPRNGYIKAMVGGRDFSNTQLNRAIMAYRQPGSTIKPFVYTAAIDSRRYTPNSMVVDEEIVYASANGEWKPQNYDRIFRGPISLRQALENSVNTIAIKLVDDLGPSKIVEYARQMGIRNLVTGGVANDLNYSALALGGLTEGVTPIEITAAYSPLANQGIKVEPFGILSVKDPYGNVLYEKRPRKSIAISAETAYVVTDMMRGVIMRGSGKSAMIDRPAAGKTGTTSDNTNAWFVGYTPDLLACVWIGNDSQRIPVKLGGAVVGSSRAARIWGIFMRKALSRTPPSDFVPPEGVATNVEICSQTGQLATPTCPDVKYEVFLSGTEPTDYCVEHQDGFDPNNFLNNENNDADPDSSNPMPSQTGDNSIRQPGFGNAVAPARRKRTIMVKTCNESGMLATPNCPENQVVGELFTEGEEPTQYCTVHKRR
ncbi:MAG TPA: PBP1A family penicillin-binding protein [Bacillota bacterium]|nr:PBP1A family penicillin-binding protein [Bacillota bacterium]